MQPAAPKQKHFNTTGLQKLHDFQSELTEPRFVELFGSLGQHLHHKYISEYGENLLDFFVSGLDDENKDIISRELHAQNIIIN